MTASHQATDRNELAPIGSDRAQHGRKKALGRKDATTTKRIFARVALVGRQVNPTGVRNQR
jgi:hypothetical protein